jgi:hypothetical protein
MRRSDRKKASEIFRETNYPFVKKVSFTETFPQIENVIVVVEEKGSGSSLRPSPLQYDKNTLSEFIDCHNSSCYNGGFSIGDILRDMVKDKKTSIETVKFCQGYEGSPKGKRRRSCITQFNIKVEIQYVSDKADK